LGDYPKLIVKVRHWRLTQRAACFFPSNYMPRKRRQLISVEKIAGISSANVRWKIVPCDFRCVSMFLIFGGMLPLFAGMQTR
jgi:hypothetical protein